MTFDLNPNQLRLVRDPQAQWPNVAGAQWVPYVRTNRRPNVPGGPLTATFEDMPRNHDGGPFTFRVTFSEALARDTDAVQAFEMTSGEITHVEWSQRAREWQVTANPEAGEDMTITLKAEDSCENGTTPCTEQGRALERDVRATVRATTQAPAVPQVRPTVSLSGAPSEHNGWDPWTMTLTFSEAVDITAERLVNVVNETTTGMVTEAQQTSTDTTNWRLTVYPPAHHDSIVTVQSSGACGEPRAICTSDGRAVENRASVTIIGPPQLTCPNTAAYEGRDTTIDFVCTLSRPHNAATSVGWQTVDDTAKAGEDYVAASGRLEFGIGDTQLTIPITLIDDAIDEGHEQFKIALQHTRRDLMVNGIAVMRRVVYGFIYNDDAMPKAWISRFGRTVGTHAVDTISNRFGADTPEDENSVRIAGQPLATDAKRLAELEGSIRRDLHHHTRESISGFLPEPYLTSDQLLTGTSFTWTKTPDGSNTTWTAWGELAQSEFEAAESDLALQGRVRSGFIGADAKRGRWQGGIAAGLSTGEGSFRFRLLESETDEDGGDTRSMMVSVLPYAAYNLSQEIWAWAILGIGQGDLTVKRQNAQDTARTLQAPLDMRLAAFGFKGKLLAQERGSPFNLGFRGDAMWVRTRSEATRGMEAASATVTQARLVTETGFDFEIGSGTLSPTLELGIRHDAGDAERGIGIEAGGRFRYQTGRVSIEALVRTLLTHEDDNFEEWTVSTTLQILPRPNGSGLDLKLTPAWGTAANTFGQLWEEQARRALTRPAHEPADHRIDSEIGYGFRSVLGTGGVWRPYVAATHGNASAAIYRAGTQWKITDQADIAVEVSRSGNPEAAENAVTIRAGLQW